MTSLLSLPAALMPYLIGALMMILSQSSHQPHILLMVVDDLGYTDISRHGAEYDTPNIDALFTNGVELANYYVQPTCSPTRTSIMTGKYVWKTGLQFRGTISPGTTEHIPFSMPTMAELLSSAGYATHALGKWHLGYAARNMTPMGRGFDSHFGFYQGQETYYSHHFWFEDAIAEGFDFWADDKVHLDAVGEYATDLYVERVESLLSANANASDSSPMFIYLAFQTVHVPVLDFDGVPEDPPITYAQCSGLGRNGRETYCNKIKYLDAQIGEIIRLFRAYDAYNDTVIALTSDNGGMPFWNSSQAQSDVARGISWGCNYPLRGGKATEFEGGIRGAAVISGNLIAQRNLANTQSTVLAHAVDWLATFVEGVAGAQLRNDDTEFDSQNMWDAIGDAALWNRTTLFVDITEEQSMYAVINETEDGHRWKLINSTAKYWLWYQCNGTIDRADEAAESVYLFDLANDPNEHNNLLASNEEVANALFEMVQQQAKGGQYYPEQDRTLYKEAYPEQHLGVWAPWLD